MNVEDRVLAMLRSAEGERQYAYDDATGKEVKAPQGKLTIGIGTNLDVGLDSYEREMLCRHRLNTSLTQLTERMVSRWPPTRLGELPDDAQVALALMVYQLGVDGVMEFHHLLDAVARGDWQAAARHALDSKWAEETPKRADEVARLFRRIQW